MMEYVLDINRLRNELTEFSGQSYNSQCAGIKNYAISKYGVVLPDGVFEVSKIGFGGIHEQIFDSPILLTRLVNAIIRKQIQDSSDGLSIKVCHPKALYSMLTGVVGKVDTENGEMAKLDMGIFGDIGDSFAFNTKIDGTIRVYGSVENYGGFHSFQGRHVYYDLSTELIGLANYGVHYLLLQGATERLHAMGRAGSVVTFGMGPDAAWYQAGGLLLDLETKVAAEKVAPGIVGGTVIAMDSAKPAKGAKLERLDKQDYEAIARVLSYHADTAHAATTDLVVEGLEAFSPDSSRLYVARNLLLAPSDGTSAKTELEGRVEIDFSHFAKIVSTIPRVEPVAPVQPKINRNILSAADISRIRSAHRKAV